MLSGLLEKAVRRVARSWLLKYVDGYKTQIMRVVQAIQAILVAAYLACPHIPAMNGMAACEIVDVVNAQWLAFTVLLGQLGLEFSIVDAKIKAKREAEEQSESAISSEQ